MAANIDNYQVKKAHESGFIPEPEDKPVKPQCDPESEEAKEKRFNQVQDWWYQARQYQSQDRNQRAIDDDFVDNDQYKEEDRYDLEVVRGQPALTYNLIAPTIFWITGTEKRSRVDFNVFPRTKDDKDGAEQKTKLLKYLSDVNRTPFHFSRAFEDAVRSGLGWIEEGIRSNPTEEPIFVRYESWRNVWYDHLSVELDLSDARYLFRSKWTDLDFAIAYFPEHEGYLRAAAESINNFPGLDDDEFYNPLLYSRDDRRAIVSDDAFNVENRRERVRLVQCEYRMPTKCKVLVGEDGKQGPFHGSIYNEKDDVQQWAVKRGLASLYDAVLPVMRLMMFCDNRQLFDMRSPYWHNKYSLTPIWGRRKRRDNSPYGAVRALRDPQEDLNKRFSKALFILSTNQVIMDQGAADKEELAEEVARPDGIIEKKPGATLEIRNDKALAREHVMLMEQDAMYIQKAGGVTDENMGRETNATSGKAIERRQDQGVTVNTDFFDNLRFAFQISGEKQLSLCEQFCDQAKIFRLTEDTGRPGANRMKADYVQVQNDEDGLNHITRFKADFKVDEQAYRDTVRQMMVESMINMIGKLDPNITIQFLDLVFDMSDMPMRDEFVKRIREINGKSDPDEEKDPAQAQAEADAKQFEQDVQQRTIMANLAILEADAKRKGADGDLALIKAIKEKVESMKGALEVAGAVATAPQLGAAADNVLDDASKGLMQQ